MILIYHMLCTGLFVLALPFLPVVWIFSKKRRANLVWRLGLKTCLPVKAAGSYRVWIHALSVGEVNSALPLVRQLRERRPEIEIVLTASTRTGFETAKRLIKDSAPLAVGYFPFDLWFSIARVTARIDPDLVCLVETDLWPGFLSMMKARKTPVVLVNARLSPRSLKGYLRLGFFRRFFFSCLTHVMAQTRIDAQRFERVGVAPKAVSVAGNLKFDQPCPAFGSRERERIREDFGIGTGQKAWVAGSTHHGEETLIEKAFASVKSACPDFKLILAPRDPGRCRLLARALAGGQWRVAQLSDAKSLKQAADIILIDRLGVLVKAYAVSEFAFVGGSIVAQGGHNPLEPAMFGKPVIFGPHMTDFHEVASLLVAGGGAVQVGDGNALGAGAVRLAGDASLSNAMGEAAARVFDCNCGAVDRTIDLMEKIAGV